ncbi:acyltransferase family protein [Hymenobacter metallilatus]|uniref:Acyltransferase n=1 Tax=Hymenobacter metallilatus TaxID=2493666 RepID=A0A3R9NBT0_9BACT|nr:acyltransferase [Hymenobacter metallilatus]RSK24099.1 acyltransferase [Hymenobacter metallilatus]
MSLKSVKYFPALTGLRAIAAFMVFFHHFNPIDNKSYLSFKIFDQGSIGVSVFYVLSGLLIASRYQNRIDTSIQWWKTYMRNRFARIYPLYFLLLLPTIVLGYLYPYSYVMHLDDWAAYTNVQKGVVTFLNLTLLKGFSESFKFSGIGQSWSLTVEECFYISAPFIILFARRTKWWMLTSVFALITTGIVLTSIFSHKYMYGFFGSYEFLFNYTFFGRCFEFILGMKLASLLRIKEFNHGAKFTLIGVLYISSIIFLEAYFNIEKQSYNGIIINNLILPFGICFLLFGLATETTWLYNILSGKIFDLLGKSSYAFYLVHMGFASIILDHFNIQLLWKFFTLNIVAIFLYKVIEHPVHTWIAGRKK